VSGIAACVKDFLYSDAREVVEKSFLCCKKITANFPSAGLLAVISSWQMPNRAERISSVLLLST
jgi:hypothetical protein